MTIKGIFMHPQVVAVQAISYDFVMWCAIFRDVE